MKKLILAFTVIFTILISVSCEQDEKNAQGSEEIQLTSPNGFKTASTINDLKSALELNQDAKIVAIEYLDAKKANAAIVTFNRNEKSGIENIALASGEINYDVGSISATPAGTKQVGGKWKISCDGCPDCIVSGSIKPDGTITFSCSRDCCKATVISEPDE